MGTDFKTLLAEARLPERTLPVCLRGDLVAEFEELDRRLAEAQQTVRGSMEGDPQTATLAERIESVREDMRLYTYTFRIRALPRAEYRKVKADHPPRLADDGKMLGEDVILDANLETFGEALLRLGLVDPVLDSEEWDELVGKLTDRQYSDLLGTAITVNKGEIDVPFSSAASNLRRTSEPE